MLPGSYYVFMFLSAGNSRWVTAMDWSGQIEYAKADWKKFEVDGEEAGLTTGYGPLQFLKVITTIDIVFTLQNFALYADLVYY